MISKNIITEMNSILVAYFSFRFFGNKNEAWPNERVAKRCLRSYFYVREAFWLNVLVSVSIHGFLS